jgi:hypothetical protein
MNVVPGIADNGEVPFYVKVYSSDRMIEAYRAAVFIDGLSQGKPPLKLIPNSATVNQCRCAVASDRPPVAVTLFFLEESAIK